tara:strand:- start:907 stop:1191 length:285 start_codon:yes stop_codon:yes gene_type:complete
VINEKEVISKDTKKATEHRDKAARQAWRGWVIPAVGSMAFFASMFINGFRNYKNHGFPAHVFTNTDWVLLSLPVVVVVVSLSDIFINGEEYGSE